MIKYADILRVARKIGFDAELFDGDEIVIYTDLTGDNDTEHVSLYTNSWTLKGYNIQAMAEIYHVFVTDLNVRLKLELRV